MSSNNLKKIKVFSENLKYLKSRSAYAGVFNNEKGNQTYEEDETVLSVGKKHEFGYGKIPQRSFIRMPMQEKKSILFKYASSQVKNVDEGKDSIHNVLDNIALKMKDIIIGAFQTGGYNKWQKLSKVTIDLKGNDKILIDTSKLKDSIDCIVLKDRYVTKS